MDSNPTNEWAGCCYDHYVLYLREPAERLVFRSHVPEASLQMLRFAQVFDGCQVFCTIGLNRIVGSAVEVCIVTDGEFLAVPPLVAKTFFTLSQKTTHVCWGDSVRGLQNIDPAFVERTGKNAIYFAQPNFLPHQFESVRCGNLDGSIWSLMFISSEEYEFLQANGPATFEARLQKAGVDPFSLDRPSVC